MLYGVPPFKVNSMQELQQKVQTQSGNNTNFPPGINLSDNCKDLIKRLMQADATRHIEWKDFFKHPLFDSSNKKDDVAPDMKIAQSVMFHNNKGNVDKEFMNNKNDNIDDVELVDPLEINLDNAPNKKVDTPVSNKQHELNMKRIKFRLTHEKKTIVFMMHTCRKVRNLAKARKFLGSASDNLMFGGMLLLRKGQRLNEQAITSIKNHQDIFGLNGYKEFTESKDSEQILSTLKDDEKLYMTLFSHLQKKAQEEVSPNDKRLNQVLRFINDSHVSVNNLNKLLEEEFFFLLQDFNHHGEKLDQALKKDYSIALGHMYLSLRNEQSLPFIENEHIFDWKDFENSLNLDYIKNLLNKANDEAKGGKYY